MLVPLALRARSADPGLRLRFLGAGVLAAVLVVGPWVVYNLTRFDEPVLMSTNFGVTLTAANCHNTYFGEEIGFKEYNCAFQALAPARRDTPGFDRLDEGGKDAALRKVAVRYIRSHLRRAPVVVAARVGRISGVYKPFFEVGYNHYLFHEDRSIGYSLVWTYYAVALLAIGGAVVLRRRRVPVWPLGAIVAIVLVSVAVTFGQIRYRAPAEVPLVLLAASCLGALGSRGHDRRRDRREQRPDSTVAAGGLAPSRDASRDAELTR